MINQSDTPETDAMTWKGHCGDGDWGDVVYSDFARNLERERNEARRQLELAEDIILRMLYGEPF